jgi:hypothetical protein
MTMLRYSQTVTCGIVLRIGPVKSGDTGGRTTATKIKGLCELMVGSGTGGGRQRPV